MRSLYELGLLLTLMPELKDLENLGQSEHHHLDVLSHILLMIEKISWASEWIGQKGRNIPLSQEDRLSLYYAVLFHDIGKQDTYSKDEKGRVHFYDHEAFSCQRAEGIMERLRFSNTMRNRILRSDSAPYENPQSFTGDKRAGTQTIGQPDGRSNPSAGRCTPLLTKKQAVGSYPFRSTKRWKAIAFESSIYSKKRRSSIRLL